MRRKPRRSHIRTAGLVALAIVAAFVVGEGFYRLLKPTGLDFDSQFRPYPYRFDEHGQFVFGWPGYRGFMRPVGTDRNVPLELDGHGIRPPSTTPGPGPAKQVLVLGGSSQTFGFGLRNEDSWPARMALHACEPLTAHVYVHPGQNAWHGYAHFEFAAKMPFKPDYIVLSNYQDYIWRHRGRWVPTPRTGPQSLVVIRGWYYPRDWYHAGWLVHSALLNRIMTSQVLRDVGRAWRFARALAQPARPDGVQELVGRENFLSFLTFLQSEADRFGAKLLIVAMPSGRRGDYYAEIRDATPDAIPFVDLHREVEPTAMRSELLADGHWNETMTDFLGRRVAETLCGM